MELRVLNYFLIVAREENITRAANILHITQPTLSRQLMQLEEELGIKIFNRSNHKIVLTEEGVLLKRRAEEIVSLMEKTKSELMMGETLSGEIVIGCGEFSAFEWLAEKITEFRKIHPEVIFNIVTSDADHTKEGIESGNIDIGLLLEPVDIQKYEFIRLPVEEEWGFAVKADAYENKTCITKEDVKNENLLLPSRTIIRERLARWAGVSADQLHVAGYQNLHSNSDALVLRNAGILYGVRPAVLKEGLKFLPLEEEESTGVVAVWKRNVPYSPAAEAFIRYMQEEE